MTTNWIRRAMNALPPGSPEPKTGDAAQIATCDRFSAKFIPALEGEKLGLAISTLGQLPINGLRHRPAKGTCGWYIWSGDEFSDASDFFTPLHVSHIRKYCAEIHPYLGLPPGWRFVLAPGHEDVWFDHTIDHE